LLVNEDEGSIILKNIHNVLVVSLLQLKKSKYMLK